MALILLYYVRWTENKYSLYFSFLRCYFLPTTKSEFLALDHQLVFGPPCRRGRSHSGERKFWTEKHVSRCFKKRHTNISLDDLKMILTNHLESNQKRIILHLCVLRRLEMWQLSLTETRSKNVIQTWSRGTLCFSQCLTCGRLINILSPIWFLTNTTQSQL